METDRSGPAPGVGIPGCCGGSHYNRKHTDCDTAGRGMWDARRAHINDLAGCVAAVSKCAMGNFASFYPPSSGAISDGGGSCGWHFSCAGWPDDITTCANVSSQYVSARVRGNASAAATCRPWVNGGSCTTALASNGGDGEEEAAAMLAASVSIATTGEIQAKLVNYGTRGVSLTVQLDTGAFPYHP